MLLLQASPATPAPLASSFKIHRRNYLLQKHWRHGGYWLYRDHWLHRITGGLTFISEPGTVASSGMICEVSKRHSNDSLLIYLELDFLGSETDPCLLLAQEPCKVHFVDLL